MSKDKEKVLVPELRFPGFSGVWEESKLGDIAIINMGQSPLSSSYSDNKNDTPLIQGNADIKNRLSAPQKFTPLPTKMCAPDSLLMTVRAPVGAVAKSIHSACIGRGICEIKPEINSDFLYQVLLQQESKWGKVEQGSTFSAISKSDINSYKVNIPNEREQTRIANFFTTLDKKIELTEKKIALLEEQKKGFMQKIFSQELRFKDENGEEFGEWEDVKLDTLEKEDKITLGRGNVIPKSKLTDGYPVYSSSTKNNGLFTLVSDYMFDEELITWSIDGGGTFFYRPKHKYSVTNVSGIMKVLSEDIDVKFLFYQLSKLHERIDFDYVTKAHPSVIKDLYKVKLPLIQEQQIIATFLSKLDSEIDQYKLILEKKKELKKGLMQRMFV